MMDNIKEKHSLLNLTFSLSCGAEKKDNRHIQYLLFDCEKSVSKVSKKKKWANYFTLFSLH